MLFNNKGKIDRGNEKISLMIKPSLSELNAFLAIAELNSFSSAAKSLGISSSALSHSLRSLEAKLSVRLFNRTTRSVALTEAGDKLLKHIRPAISSLEHAIEEAASSGNLPSGTIRISSSESGATPLLKHVIPDFLNKYPRIRVEFIVETRFIDIVSEGYDAGIRLHEDVPKDMIAVCFQPPMMTGIVASPDYLKRYGEPDTVQDLSRHRCLRYRFESGGLMDWELNHQGTPVTVNLDDSVTFVRGSTLLVLEAVLNGLGLALLPLKDVRHYLESGRLRSVLPASKMQYSGLSLYYPANRHLPPAVALFIDAVRNYAVTGRRESPE